MSLSEYARKRDFTKTPEPPPKPGAKKAGELRFYIQRHDATRLHYDFRLEMSGMLKSWAIPKGPSLDPGRKQLAMHVEDHPLDYGPFEGNIPKGSYGAGSVMLWDQGRWESFGEGTIEEQYQRGDLKVRLHGEKLNGDWALVRMKGRGKGNEWLLIKKRDDFANPSWDIEEHAHSVKTARAQEEIAEELPPAPARKAAIKKTRSKKKSVAPEIPKGAVARAMPGFFEPMKAFSTDKPPAGSNWIYEIKWDGVRALCYIEDGKIRMYSRNGNSFDRQYPELMVVPHYVDAETAILDGEIAVLDEKGRPKFELIQPRIHQTDPNSVAHLARKTPVKLFVFDLLYYNGHDLRACALIDRKELLRSVLKQAERVQLSGHFESRGDEVMEAARQAGLEGIVAKDRTSKYESRRSNCWLKLKVTGQQEFVICGYTHGERTTFSSLVLGIYERGGLVFVGCVGTGFNDKSLADLYKKLQALETGKMPFAKRPDMLRRATWVKPELVCEVRFVEWTQDGRLRAPVFLGLRTDKKPAQVSREEAPVSDSREEDTAEALAEGGPLFPPKVKELAIRVDGHPVKFTNLNKIWYPKDGCTKRDVLNYYNDVAALILPYLRDRPLSLKRYPNGIHEEFFFQKDIPETYPDWLRREPIHSAHRGAPINFVIANDRATLLYLANLACIDQNPWMSRIGSLDCPDYMLIDLDPQECNFEKIIEAALLVRETLDTIGLDGWPKTTGGDGLHVFVPLEPRYSYDQVRSFAEIAASLVVQKKPDLFTTPRSVAKRRKGRVYFDYLQISTGKTIAAPYVLRAYDGAPVATPLKWDEVKPGLRPEQFHIRNAVERFRSVGDLFEPVLHKRQRLEPALRKLEKMAT